MSGNRMQVALAAVAASLVLPQFTGVAFAQGSGTLLSQTVTLVKGATNPTISFRVKGYKGVGTSTLMLLEIGPEGNSTLPAANPSLPASARFIVRKSGVATSKEFTPPASGSVSDNNTTFAGENVSLDRLVENSADPRGLYRLIVGHLTELDEGITENWSLELTDVPAGLRVIASINMGDFTNLTPPPSACGSSAACPSTCPAGQACREPCPFRVCLGPIRLDEIPEFRWPRRPGPGPWCLSCPIQWRGEFDRSRFERIVVTFVPTKDQRIGLEGALKRDIQFNVTGGETVGDVFEGSGGELYQLVQYPKGKPPLVDVTSGGEKLAQFRAEPQLSADAKRYRNLSYGLGALLLVSLAGIGVSRRRGRRGGGPGDPGVG